MSTTFACPKLAVPPREDGGMSPEGADSAGNSLRVSDGGTLKLLSKSYGEYLVSRGGIQKKSELRMDEVDYQISSADLQVASQNPLGR